MKKSLFLSLFLSCSCSTNVDVGVVNPSPGASANITVNSSQTTFSQKEIAGLKFNKISDQNIGLINNQNNNRNQSKASQTGVSPNSLSNPQAPLPLGASQRANGSTADAAVGKGGAESSRSSYGGYFASQNPFEEYAMTDYEEAQTKGFTGTFIETYNAMVKPLIKEWTNDAKASSVYGNAGSDGKGIDNVANWYSPYQWQYTYVSQSKKEVYSVLVSSKETLVLRQKWNLKNLNDQNIKIDSSTAIKTFIEKIKDKNYNAEYDNNNLGPNSQPLYDIPPNNYWTFYLSQEKSSLIWNINTNYLYPTVAPQPLNGQSYVNTWYSGGYAKIDASTGVLLYMTRPVKYTETVQMPTDYKCDNNGCISSQGSGGATP